MVPVDFILRQKCKNDGSIVPVLIKGTKKRSSGFLFCFSNVLIVIQTLVIYHRLTDKLNKKNIDLSSGIETWILKMCLLETSCNENWLHHSSFPANFENFVHILTPSYVCLANEVCKTLTKGNVLMKFLVSRFPVIQKRIIYIICIIYNFLLFYWFVSEQNCFW